MLVAIEMGMMRKQTVSLLLTLVALSVPSAYANSASATMNVSVQVIARTIVTVGQQPAAIDVTAGDIQRGYIDLPAAVAFQVRSNARNGYALQFEPVGGPFSQAQVKWGNSTAVVGADGSWLSRSYQSGTASGLLDVRLVLSADANPGSYAWPVRFDANSL
jgi:hypothetical protein